ncbi:MAG TPA: DedA family protein [Stellaceae bacterium]|jgi:undecaprenyl-diphosphatase
MDDLVHPMLALVAAHPHWAIAIMFVTSFGESFVFLGLLFPGTTLLIAAGALMADGTLPYWGVIVGAVAGAVLGDTVSYWIGRRYGSALGRIWPFNRDPEMLTRGIHFFERHGGKSVFIGRFFGPLRAVVPLAAGVLQMPSGWFWFANVTSALVWAPMLLFVGDAIGQVGDRLIGAGTTAVLVIVGLTLFGLAGIAWAAWRARKKD